MNNFNLLQISLIAAGRNLPPSKFEERAQPGSVITLPRDIMQIVADYYSYKKYLVKCVITDFNFHICLNSVKVFITYKKNKRDVIRDIDPKYLCEVLRSMHADPHDIIAVNDVYTRLHDLRMRSDDNVGFIRDNFDDIVFVLLAWDGIEYIDIKEIN